MMKLAMASLGLTIIMIGAMWFRASVGEARSADENPSVSDTGSSGSSVHEKDAHTG